MMGFTSILYPIYMEQNDLDRDLGYINLYRDQEDLQRTFIVQYNKALHICIHCSVIV